MHMRDVIIPEHLPQGNQVHGCTDILFCVGGDKRTWLLVPLQVLAREHSFFALISLRTLHLKLSIQQYRSSDWAKGNPTIGSTYMHIEICTERY